MPGPGWHWRTAATSITARAEKQHRKLLRKRRPYVTSDFVLAELIDYVYDAAPAAQAQALITGLLTKADSGLIRLVHVLPDQFRRAWLLRQKYHDKPDVSFVDFTSMVVMQDVGITDVFTGDAHFQQVGLGFRLLP
ncbi:MAG: type II toxin-antitoxin system VapC family toxin [Planctomycetes bacterium]|nr:type II toxin-antitoxin system VapC family toxin [Planctomycetota bacterium]